MIEDRIVHGTTAYGATLVRYDRAGKWYVEHDGKRWAVTVAEAAELMAEPGARWFAERPGSQALTPKVRRIMAARGKA